MPGLKDDSVQGQELYCHACGGYVRFDLDLALDGNHVLECPNCGHEHCRVVKGGVITDARWDRRNGPTYAVAASVVSWYSQSATTANPVYWYAQSISGGY